MKRQPVLTLTAVKVSRWRQLRALPAVLLHHYAAARANHGSIVAFVLCWKLAGLRLQIV
jgi:hypothetical protein